jgi:hypothetical protein
LEATMKIFVVGVLALASVLGTAANASASCRIHNDTSYSFTVESGNTSNQSVGSHTTTSIAAGRIVGRSKDGKSISGSCKDNDQLEVTDDHGVPVMVVK